MVITLANIQNWIYVVVLDYDFLTQLGRFSYTLKVRVGNFWVKVIVKIKGIPPVSDLRKRDVVNRLKMVQKRTKCHLEAQFSFIFASK